MLCVAKIYKHTLIEVAVNTHHMQFNTLQKKKKKKNQSSACVRQSCSGSNSSSRMWHFRKNKHKDEQRHTGCNVPPLSVSMATWGGANRKSEAAKIQSSSGRREFFFSFLFFSLYWDTSRTAPPLEKQTNSCCSQFPCVCVCLCACVSAAHSQHEVLLPAGLVTTHCDGCALHILHLQRHVGVKLVWNNKHKKKCRKQPELHWHNRLL